MSLRSRGEAGASAMRGSGRPSTCVPLKWLISASSEAGASTSMPPAQAASPPEAAGQMMPRPAAAAPIAAGSTPATGSSAPSSASSPSAT